MKANTKHRLEYVDYLLDGFPANVNTEFVLESLEGSDNPIYAWLAIYFATEAGKPIPGWVIPYLAQCSKRMIMVSAQDASDLRKVLPGVLGFKKRPGPGKLLKPYLDLDKSSFTNKFARYIIQGKDPETARKDACNHTFKRKFADKVDDKTLDRYLVECMGLKKKPKTANQWKTAVYKWVLGHAGLHAFLNADATEEDRERAHALIKRGFE
jgi:hypothetical protein